MEAAGNNNGKIARGGGGHINPANSEEHRGAIRQAARRWPKRFRAIDEEKRSGWVEGLEVAKKVALDVIANGGATYMVGTDGKTTAVFESPLDAARVLISVAKTGGALDAIKQKDEHAAAGITETVINNNNNNTIIAIPPPVRARIDGD